VLGLLLAYNHVYHIASYTHIVLFGGCFLAILKVWNVCRSRSIDPFDGLQNFVWLVLTTFSIQHPDWEEEEPVAKVPVPVPVPTSASDGEEKTKDDTNDHLKKD